MKVSVDSVYNPTVEPYTATASVGDGRVDASTSKVTGDRTGGLFKADKELGKSDFLKLLVTQLQYQDPLSPMENTEFVSQLAQFSALEGTENVQKAIADMNTSFKETLAAQNFSAQATTNASAVSLIGKEVRLKESTVNWKGGADQESDVRVHLGNNASALVRIVDAEGTTVKTFDAKNKDAENSVRLTWDGIGDNGEPVKTGTYGVWVDGQEEDASLYSFVQDVVQGIRFTAEGPLVKAGGKELPIGNIMDVSIGAI